MPDSYTFVAFLRSFCSAWGTLVSGVFAALMFAASGVLLFLARLGLIDPGNTATFGASVAMWSSGTVVVIWAAYRVWRRELIARDVDAAALAVFRDAEKRPVIQQSGPHWVPSIDITAVQLLFNLRATHLMTVGHVRLTVLVPDGRTVMVEQGAGSLPADGTIWFGYPQHFHGAGRAVNGRYEVRWEIQESGLWGMPVTAVFDVRSLEEVDG